MGDRFSASGVPQPNPLHVAVTGHAGSGRETLAAALTDWFGVSAARAEHPSGADLAVHVLGAGVRGCDHRFLSRLRVPVVIVAGKADLRGDDRRRWGTAAADLAACAAEELSVPVHPVSGLLARAAVTTELLTDLDRWRRAGVVVPPIASAFAEVAEVSERRRRAAALVTLGAAGLAGALALRVAHPDLDAGALTRALRSGSGMRALAEPIVSYGPVIADQRVRRRRRELAVRAADCLADRDELEARVLAGPLAWGAMWRPGR